MSQNITNQRSQQSINAPFRVKSAGVSLVVILMILMYYIANLLTLLPSDEAVPDGALSLTITAILLIIMIEGTLQIVLFVGAGQVEARTESDDNVTARASRNAYFVLTIGTFATFGSMFADFTPFEMGSLLMGAFLLAEIVKFASQLVYYWRSANR